ncbi:MAG: DUF4129 domain-containing protein [Saprospiraceae bacterium]|nr:DUF4129 domain-containing protein [Saprospiraceae bacterium]
MRLILLLTILCISTLWIQAQTETTIPVEAVPVEAEAFQAEETTLPEEETYEEMVTESRPAPPPAPVDMRRIDDEKWDKTSGKMDYSKDVPNPPKEIKPVANTPDTNWLGAFEGLGTILQVLAIIIAIVLIGWGVWRMMDQPANRRIATDGVVINAENLDAYLHETDLDVFLREALQAQDFKLAIRIRYLQAIKHLTDRGQIQWAKEKTNREYVREMRPQPKGEAFRQATQVYERAWYGNRPLRATEFAVIEPLFTGLMV